MCISPERSHSCRTNSCFQARAVLGDRTCISLEGDVLGPSGAPPHRPRARVCQCTALLPANPPQLLTGARADVRHVDEGPCVLDQSGVMQRDARAEALGVHRLTELRVGHGDGGFVIPCGKKLQLRPLSLGRALLQAPATPHSVPQRSGAHADGRFALLLVVLQPGLETGTAWGHCVCLGARGDAGPRPPPCHRPSAVLTQLLDALLVLDEELDPWDVDVQAGALRGPLHRRVKAAVILAVR